MLGAAIRPMEGLLLCEAAWPRYLDVVLSGLRAGAGAACRASPRIRARWCASSPQSPREPRAHPRRALRYLQGVTAAADLDLPLVASGKVREIYDLGDRLLLVASDRISTYDVVHPNGIPDKGNVLTGISAFWFNKTGHIVPNHYISATEGVPAEVRGRAMAVQKLKMLPVECVVRGYITGSGWKDYQATGKVSGIELPPGLRESAEAADADLHAVDQGRGGPRRGHRHRRRPPRSSATRELAGAPARRLDRAVLLRRRPRRRARRDPGRHEVRVRARRGRRADPRRRGADAGLLALLARRGLRARPRPAVASTSSTCATGRRRPAGTRAPPAPEVPADVVAGTRAKYVEAYELITGEPFAAWLARTAA